MPDLIIILIVWFVFRAVVTNAKKKETARRGEQGGRTDAPARPQGLGGWAEMLLGSQGAPREESEPEPWPADAFDQHPAPEPPPEPKPSVSTPARPMQSSIPSLMERYVPTEGLDTGHEYMLSPMTAGPAPGGPADARAQGFPLRLDAPALVQAVVFSEVLTRPAQRRRPGVRPGR